MESPAGHAASLSRSTPDGRQLFPPPRAGSSRLPSRPRARALSLSWMDLLSSAQPPPPPRHIGHARRLRCGQCRPEGAVAASCISGCEPLPYGRTLSLPQCADPHAGCERPDAPVGLPAPLHCGWALFGSRACLSPMNMGCTSRRCAASPAAMPCRRSIGAVMGARGCSGCDVAHDERLME